MGATNKWYNSRNMAVERVSPLGEDEVDDVFVPGEVKVLADGSREPPKELFDKIDEMQKEFFARPRPTPHERLHLKVELGEEDGKRGFVIRKIFYAK